MIENKKPNPGSDEAIKEGCTCPYLDNNHGKGIGNGLFWMNMSCPVHGFGDPP